MIVSSAFQGQGIGNNLLNMAKEKNEELNGWVVLSDQYSTADGRPYKSPVDFYNKNEFKVFEQIVSETHKLNAVLVKWTKS